MSTIQCIIICGILVAVVFTGLTYFEHHKVNRAINSPRVEQALKQKFIRRDLINKIRADHNLTVAQFCSLANVSEAALWRFSEHQKQPLAEIEKLIAFIDKFESDK